ncbi:MAG: hypothetical protein ACFB6R_04015 [Alphaproteobacteria bacterium]
MKTVLLVVSLLGLLAFAGWFAYREWTLQAATPMDVHGWIALGLGFVFTVVLGVGLMALSFYSARAGYDDPDDDKPPQT